MCLFCRSLLSLFLTGIAVELTLSPIALYHFHQSGILCAFANIVAIPLTTFVIMPVEALALLLDLVGLGAPAWWITGQALDLLLALAHFIASRPGSMAMLPVFPEWTRSEEHTSELQSLMRISYAVFCLKKKKNNKENIYINLIYNRNN